MKLEIKLDDDCVTKLAYIQKQTNQDLGAAIQQAIQQYYEQIQTINKQPLEIFNGLGLVGCFNGDPDLSVNYKTKMIDGMKTKQE